MILASDCIIIFAVEKAKSITCSANVFVALVIQHAKRMRLIILSSVACPDLLHFSTLSHERHGYQEESC